MKQKSCAVVLVFNSEGTMALQLRAAHDDAYPLHWDFSAAGGIQPGEDPEKAAHREFYEELGVGGALQYMGEQQYEDDLEKETVYLYRTIHNGPFTPDPQEVAAVRFFSIAVIDSMLQSKEKFHPEFRFFWPLIKKWAPSAGDLPKIGSPATRALWEIGVTHLKQLSAYTKDEIQALHGMGPKALSILEKTLTQHKLTFKKVSQ